MALPVVEQSPSAPTCPPGWDEPRQDSDREITFLGYLILLAATVPFYSGQHEASTGKPAEVFFEPELVTRNGLFRVALPVAVLLFLLRFGRSTTARQPAETDAP